MTAILLVAALAALPGTETTEKTTEKTVQKETFRQVLTDVDRNLRIADWSISSADLSPGSAPAWRVHKDILHGGRQEGQHYAEREASRVGRGRKTDQDFPEPAPVGRHHRQDGGKSDGGDEAEVRKENFLTGRAPGSSHFVGQERSQRGMGPVPTGIPSTCWSSRTRRAT